MAILYDRLLNLRMPTEALDQLDQVSQARAMKRSDYARQAIRRAVEADLEHGAPK